MKKSFAKSRRSGQTLSKISNPITLVDVKVNPEVVAYLQKADEHMAAVGYTEHGYRHANLTANIAHNIMEQLRFPKRDAELAAIAGYLHDVGNVVGRYDHGEASAFLVNSILKDMGMDPLEIAVIMGAVGNHEEEKGDPVSNIASALILADKSDVHHSRVRNPHMISFDIHDRVNYAAKKSFVRVNGKDKTITLEVIIDTEVSKVMEYFEIFLSRMIMCQRAAKFLGCNFRLVINNVRFL
ncbi:MAG: HD domain-containing protein [Candidatus Omnitrophota bacterium]